MNRRLLSLAAALGILTVGLLVPVPTATASDCDDCYESCNQIPIDTQICLEESCPECAGGRLNGGS